MKVELAKKARLIYPYFIHEYCESLVKSKDGIQKCEGNCEKSMKEFSQGID